MEGNKLVAAAAVALANPMTLFGKLNRTIGAIKAGTFMQVMGNFKRSWDDAIWELRYHHEMKSWRPPVCRNRKQRMPNRYRRRFRAVVLAHRAQVRLKKAQAAMPVHVGE